MNSYPISHDPVARGSRRLRVVVIVATVVITLVYVLARLEADFGGLKVAFGEHGAEHAGPAFLLDAGIAFLVFALFRLQQMLRLLGAGETFSSAVVQRFRAFAFWLMLSAACGFAAPMLQNLFAETGDDALRLAFDMRQLLVFGIAALLFLIARLLERARAYEQDSREIV